MSITKTPIKILTNPTTMKSRYSLGKKIRIQSIICKTKKVIIITCIAIHFFTMFPPGNNFFILSMMKKLTTNNAILITEPTSKTNDNPNKISSPTLTTYISFSDNKKAFLFINLLYILLHLEL